MRIGRVLLLSGIATVVVACASVVPQLSGGGPVAPGVVVASIPVGEGPTLLALSPDGGRLYAAANSKLSVLNTSNNAIVATVPIEPYPAGLALTADGSRAFVSNLFAVRLTVLDTATNAVMAPLQLFTGRSIGGFGRIALSADGRTVYVANAANQAMAIVDVVKGDTDAHMMDMQPVDIAIAPNGRYAYVAGCKNFCTTGTIEVFDTSSRLVTASISVGSRPYRITLSPDGAHAYTTNLADPSVSVVDLESNQATATVSVPVEPTGLAISRDGALIFVASQPTGTITVIGTATNAVLTSTKVAANLRDVVVTPDGRCVYASTLDSVLAIDARSLGAT